jgi:uncharacterized membrane protein YhhN
MLPVWKIIGFVLYVVLYYHVLDAYDKRPDETMTSVAFKLLPMMHLVFVVVSSSMEDEQMSKPVNYRWSILAGLLASSVGDILLVFNDYFVPGAFAFGIGHCCYICAFGIRPRGNGAMAASFAILAVATYFFVLHGLPFSIIKVACTIYTGVIFTMVWRSAVQMHFSWNIDNVCACLGAILFVVSDIMLTMIKFHGSFHYAPFWSMLFYYGAQLLMALSASTSVKSSFVPAALKKTD